jgi:hypothetical protein
MEGPALKRMDIAEFRNEGYLQEVNRQFFHPLGLDLVTNITEDGIESLGGIWDHRDDPEGVFYEDADLDITKAERIRNFMRTRMRPRLEAVGYWFQPAGKE